MARIACWFLMLYTCGAAEVKTIVRSSQPLAVTATITSAGWIDREEFFKFAEQCTATITNARAWRDFSDYWTVTAVFTNGGIGFTVNAPNVQASTVEWLTVVRNAGQEASVVQIVVANSIAWAGSTRARIVITRNPAPQILDHELYHYWSGCGDEYTYQGIELDAAAPSVPNLASSWYNAYLKWGDLIESGMVLAPVEGGFGWYKSTASECIMFNPYKAACPVCYRAQRSMWLRMIDQTEKPKALIKPTITRFSIIP